ncbi:hypothetical protein M5238_004359 [Vibrio vulnificus]|uniref:hypothetical protein n=1 Tax=Vibrio vulnificus TaxID=672 RepID=UPI002A2BDBD4|nr:hypothetical protein [Vibrio vulnificus]
MLKLESKFIKGSSPSASTLQQVRATMNLPKDSDIQFSVFEVNYQNKKYFCCWSGGALTNGEPQLTLTGLAALESLMNHKPELNGKIHFQELRLGQTPIKSKVKKVLKKLPAQSKICFIGDMERELDGHMTSAFNLVHD